MKIGLLSERGCIWHIARTVTVEKVKMWLILVGTVNGLVHFLTNKRHYRFCEIPGPLTELYALSAPLKELLGNGDLPFSRG